MFAITLHSTKHVNRSLCTKSSNACILSVTQYVAIKNNILALDSLIPLLGKHFPYLQK